MDERLVQALLDAGAAASGQAAEATGPAVDLEPDLAAAVRAVDAPVVRQLREQAQSEALALDDLRVEAAALVGDLHTREVLAETGEEDDPLVAAQPRVADGVADDLRGEERHRVLDVLVEAVRHQRAPGEPGGLGPRLEGEEHLACVRGGGHGSSVPRPRGR